MSKTIKKPESDGKDSKPIQKPIKPPTGNVGTRSDTGGKVIIKK